MPDISIIIPTLDAERDFGWEDRLRTSSIDAELIVRDDGSATDARNAGIREASADKLVFLDDDSVPQDSYFETVAALLDEYPVVTGRINDTATWYTGSLSPHYDQGDVGHYTDTAVGCNMALRREVIAEVGDFDERLPYGHEDTELIDRLCASYDIWYSPDLVVNHPFAESPRDYFEKQYRHGREVIPYYAIRGVDIHWKMAKLVVAPSRYTKPTVTGTVLQTAGMLCFILGMLQGYVAFRVGSRKCGV